ncbi:hypothetical protein RQP46_000691 [Phenoliferia psychrophenolica]
MRSLVLLDAQLHELVDPSTASATISSLTSDPGTNSLYAIAHEPRPDATATLSLYKLAPRGARGLPAPIATWATESTASFGNPDATVVVAFKYLQENDSLCLVLANGDIEQLFEPSNELGLEQRRENVGAVDAGIKAAVWSPDEELLALVTGDDKLVVMTKDFEVLSEGPLRTTDFGEDAPVNVGWGEKSTQFHGSVGKSAATSSSTPTATTSIPTPLSSPSDDTIPRISWRGDSAFFTVSSLDHPTPTAAATSSSPTSPRRTLRIFTRVGVLSSTSEPTAGLEHVLAWQPSGSIIAASQKTLPSGEGEGAHHVVFFERNGLRRYEFALREEERGKTGSVIRELAWNAESTLLAVWLERQEGHVVQIWHRNNYHWYLKQEITPRLSRNAKVTSVVWHPENGLELYLTTSSGVEQFSLCWDTFTSTSPPPADDGTVAVVDGTTVLLTPFRVVNIPPPMSATSLASSRPTRVPVHIAFSPISGSIVVLYPDAFVEVWSWDLPLGVGLGKANGVVDPPTLRRAFSAAQGGMEDVYARQQGSRLLLVGPDGETRSVEVPGGATRVVASDDGFLLQDQDGMIQEVSTTASTGDVACPSDTIPSLHESCPWIRHVSLPSSSTLLGLTNSGRIYAGDQLVASDATSFTTTTEYLIYTTFAHQVKFVPLAALEGEPTHVENLRKPELSGVEGTIRRAVERGSRIVAVVPSSTSLVLQMPRGNLETVCPRPLVLRIVRQDLDNLRFRAAFLSCRRHRIDLNILYDHNPQSLLDHLAEFVSQVKQVDYLNLFLSGLKNEDVTVTMYKPLLPAGGKPVDASEKVNKVCDLVRAELEKRDVFHYANTILTTHVRKKPPDYESALRVLVDLKARDADRAEEAVKYIIFLSDANKLFDLALGLYDFPLVLLIAQHSQKDPREYLPFLRELRQLDTFVQRFKIDDHLERFDSALRNLARTGADRFAEVVAYVEQHELYATALEIYQDDQAKYRVILVANAEYLMTHRRPADAGLLFSLGGQPVKAMEAYQKANAWQELFTLALTEKRTGTEIKAMAVDVAEALKGKGRFTDAGRVLQEYGRDIDGAVAVLIEGNAFVEAIRLTSLYSRRDLIDIHIKPGALEAQAKLVEDIEELMDQVQKQVERLAELKERRDANPSQYFCLDNPMSAMDNVELQPDGASDAGTAFTRYTTAGNSVATSQVSSGTSKSKRRGLLKKAAGKKGSIYEESYLLKSLKKSLEDKLKDFQVDTAGLLPVLLSLSSTAHRSAAAALQESLAALEVQLAANIVQLWTWREKEWAEEKLDDLAARDRGETVQKREVEEGLERIERPKLASTKWRSTILAQFLSKGAPLNASSFAWIKQVEYFASLPNFAVLVFDNRGSGNSTSPKGLYSTVDMAADAVVLLNYIGWVGQRSLVVVGASLGGMIAMDLARLVPARISTLVLASTKSGYRFNFPTIRTVWLMARFLFGTVWTQRQGLRLTISIMFPPMFMNLRDKDGQTRRQILEQMAAVFSHRMKAEELAELARTVPNIAIIQGDSDRIVRLRDADILHRMLPVRRYAQQL